jgi:histidine triad (HIT) family protein
MPFAYDDHNIFAKILRGEIPNDTVLETEHSLAFRDLYPQAPEHVLVIPKGPYATYDHFALAASEAEIVDFTRAVGAVSALMGAQPTEGGQGFRILSNAGVHANQDVPHMHVHVVAGRPLGGLLPPAPA